jgi:hypothetical protein
VAPPFFLAARNAARGGYDCQFAILLMSNKRKESSYERDNLCLLLATRYALSHSMMTKTDEEIMYKATSLGKSHSITMSKTTRVSRMPARMAQMLSFFIVEFLLNCLALEHGEVR